MEKNNGIVNRMCFLICNIVQIKFVILYICFLQFSFTFFIPCSFAYFSISNNEVENIINKHQNWLKKLSDYAEKNGVEDINFYFVNNNIPDELKIDPDRADFRNKGAMHPIIISDKDLRGCAFDNSDFGNSIVEEKIVLLFVNTNLCGSTFDGTILNRAEFKNTNLNAVLFEPLTNPEPANIAYSYGLGGMIYKNDPSGLIRLSKELYDSGFYQQSKLVNTAFKRCYRKYNSGWFMGCVEYLLFDATCEYGSNYWWPLILLCVNMVIFSIIYWIMILLPFKSGIIIEYKNDKEVPIRSKLPLSSNLKILFFQSLFFSLLCTFNISFKDLDFGRWFRLLLPWKIDFEAYGWTRTVSGFHSLIGVFLLAMTILSYFGRYFEGW